MIMLSSGVAAVFPSQIWVQDKVNINIDIQDIAQASDINYDNIFKHRQNRTLCSFKSLHPSPESTLSSIVSQFQLSHFALMV